MMKKIYRILFGFIVCACVYASAVTIVYAKVSPPIVVGTTVIGSFDTDVTWTRAGSPYIISGDVFINGHALTIEPGVSIISPPDRPDVSPTIHVTDSSVNIKGTPDQPVIIEGINKIHTFNSVVTVEYARLKTTGPGLILYWSPATISSSTFSGSSGAGMYIWSSKVNMLDSIIRDNTNTGIFITQDASGRTPSSVSITNSIIENNGATAISNRGSYTVHAENNWWGSPDQPPVLNSSINLNSYPTSGVLTGLISYTPWLTSKPDLEPAQKLCCSSVLFIPGLQASRLYRNETGIFGIKTNQLWEPNRNDDVKKVLLNNDGTSIDTSIYVGLPIDKGLGVFSVYDSFMKSLDNLRTNGAIGEWQSFGYDWRKSVPEVVAGRTLRATTTESLVETVEAMAERSKTGKVTIVAHSNGGLVTKYLVKTLADMGKSDLIDSVISVAVPYLGTPQAILSLLHGESQSIGGGIILKQKVARDLGVNMPSAYALVPSGEYFSKIFTPSISFASTTIEGINDGSYSKSIDSYDEQQSYIVDANNVRISTTSSASKTIFPIKGNSFLMNMAKVLHGILDPFVWPETIARWAVVGWGNKTTKGIVYSEKTECSRSPSLVRCEKYPVYVASSTSMGDGTVVIPSAVYNAGTVISIDLPAQKSIDKKEIKHSNILEASSTKSIIGTILSSSLGADTDSQRIKTIETISRLSGVSMDEPDYSREKSLLVISTHSPVNLHIYDKYGNHTGITPPPKYLALESSDDGIDDDLYTFYDEKIQGSSLEIREGYYGNETYITLEDGTDQTYSVVVEGAGIGTFDYRVERIRGDQTLDMVEYSDLPVNPLMVATGTVRTTGTSVNIQKLSSSTPFVIDIDGNGSADIIVNSKTEISFAMYVEMLKKVVIEIGDSSKKVKDVLKRIDKLQIQVAKGKVASVKDISYKLQQHISHKKIKDLTVQDKEKIISLIDEFIAQLEL